MPRKKKSTMTVGAALRVLHSLLESGQVNENTPLEIPIGDDSIGPSSGVGIECIYPGFDWDANRLFISPAEPLQKAKKKPEPAKEEEPDKAG